MVIASGQGEGEGQVYGKGKRLGARDPGEGSLTVRIFPVATGRHFDSVARRQLEVLFEAILPGTETAPGASDAGAAEFLDALLALDDAAFHEIRGWQQLYALGLPALDTVAEERFGRPLADLSVQQATNLLAHLAAGELDGWHVEIDQRRLFTTLRDHCIEGCFSDPRWGGNRGAIIWRWLGYAQPPEDLVRDETGILVPVERDDDR